MTMTFQPHEGHTAHSDLHKQILRSHLAYLNQEETPAKLEKRRSLEGLISEFLSVVTHNSKFMFVEVSDILNNSIETNPYFSAYKAESAFEALEKYATNLISHPWRKEYKIIKLYSGFYKHAVENQLIGGKSVFHLLGYQYSDFDGVLYLDEPVDPDNVARVALDCLIAYVECQIMAQICERVKSFKCSWREIHSVRQDYTCGVEESVRILHQLKRNVAEQEKQDRWLRDKENGTLSDELHSKLETALNYPQTGILVDLSNTWPNNSNSYPAYPLNSSVLQPSSVGNITSYRSRLSSKSFVPNHTKLPSWSEGVSSPSHNFIKFDETDGYAGRSLDGENFSKYSDLESRLGVSDLNSDRWKGSWEVLEPLVVQASSYPGRHNSYSNHNGHRVNSYSKPVLNSTKESHTSQFAHLYSPHHSSHNTLGHSFSPVRQSSESSTHRQTEPSLLSHRQLSESSLLPHRPAESSLQSYRQLYMPVDNDFEPIKNHNHDHLSDLANSMSKLSIDASSKSKAIPTGSTYTAFQSVDDSLSPLDIVLRTNAGSKTTTNTHSSSSRGSYYDNVPSSFDGETVGSAFVPVGESLNSKCIASSSGLSQASKPKLHKVLSDSPDGTTKQVAKKTYSNSSTGSLPDHTSILNSSLSKTTKAREKSTGSKKWSCSSCTYYNPGEKSICIMCGRSKHPGPENTPLVSGGRECPQCTLVNSKDSENCTACGTSLKDSPTYI